MFADRFAGENGTVAFQSFFAHLFCPLQNMVICSQTRVGGWFGSAVSAAIAGI
jgi:hypothetical protein